MTFELNRFLFFLKNYALAFKYGVWPGEVDILEYTKGWRISLRTGDYVQALDPMFGDLHYFSRPDFTVIPVDRDNGRHPPAVPICCQFQRDTFKSLTWRQWTGSCRTLRKQPSLLCLLLHLLRNIERVCVWDLFKVVWMISSKNYCFCVKTKQTKNPTHLNVNANIQPSEFLGFPYAAV